MQNFIEMKMKHILTIGFLLAVMLVWGQDNKLSEEKRKEFEAQKVAFFTQSLDLTPQEAAVFWPLYNEMFKKIRKEEYDIRKKLKEARDMKNLTDAQAKSLVESTLNNEQQILDIKKEYYRKLLEVVPAQKVLKLDWTEHKFHKQLLERMCKPPYPIK